jgi:hypothetical protein
MELAVGVGVRRQLAALRDNRPDKHGYEGDGFSIHIHGAGGEMAFAKFAGLYWNGSVDTFKSPDLGSNIQVRTRSGVGGREDLIVRANDRSEDVFVLVVGQMPNYTVVGWRSGMFCKKPAYAREYGGRPSAYFVPRADLNDFDLLAKIA